MMVLPLKDTTGSRHHLIEGCELHYGKKPGAVNIWRGPSRQPQKEEVK
jgi:hypothetical protein